VKAAQRLTAIIEREDDGFVALCPEYDVASQGASIEDARINLIEALLLFFETASPFEVARRLHDEVLSLRRRCRLGRLRVLSGSEVCRILEQHGFAASGSKVATESCKSVGRARR
jgi:predicted RNase H-like HicB family nuclease